MKQSSEDKLIADIRELLASSKGKANGWNHERLAVEIGCSTQTLYNWTNGSVKMSRPYRQLVARFLEHGRIGSS